jgi:steroid delta-isomerase-like uncharacterized protein
MAEDPKTFVRRFFDGVNAGDFSVIDELVADDFVEREEFPGIEPNKAGVRQFFDMFRSAFPDFRMETHEIVAEGDLACVRSTTTGTHEGEFMGVPPTGKRIEVPGFDLVRIRDGQAVEHWGLLDAMTLMQQLGAIPEEAPA